MKVSVCLQVRLEITEERFWAQVTSGNDILVEVSVGQYYPYEYFTQEIDRFKHQVVDCLSQAIGRSLDNS